MCELIDIETKIDKKKFSVLTCEFSSATHIMRTVFVLLFLVKFSEISAFDDALCDRQLEYFTSSLANPRERWAIESKNYLDYFLKVVMKL